MPNYSNQTPNWQPLSRLPLIAQMIDEGLAQALAQYQNLQQAQNPSSDIRYWITKPLNES
ncbi:hypothetical protein WA1_02710 [Scytonema hofmannii PCC 7110]|uniref:Uncharacterized protein n=1 Tax=Scytonema hofmannii PCC 7110 TaxID=128403 RepID=A0A139XHB3_9CYAN|nr:hypothetical protein [Scytonema hofmannii]KYC44071.1 hypothetical protein WA1_02710 [Scytonema hofmannii PCC 7110]